MTVQQYCLRWNNHQPNFISVFSSLLSSQSLVDVTLAAEGKHLQAHKVVLSACSSYFQSLFTVNPCKHPIVILKDVKFTDLKVMVDFMYHGEVNVSQEQLPCILKTAEMLKIKGLTEIPVDQSTTTTTTTTTRCQSRTDKPETVTHSEENWNVDDSNRPISPSSPSSKRKRLKKNVICSTSTATETSEGPSSDILLSSMDNVFGGAMKVEQERYPTVMKSEPNKYPTENVITTMPQKCNGVPVPSIQAGPSHELNESEPSHHISLQVTPHDVVNTSLECSQINMSRTTTTAPQTTTVVNTQQSQMSQEIQHMGPKRGRFLMRQPRIKRESDPSQESDCDTGSPQYLTVPPIKIERQCSEPIPSISPSPDNLLHVTDHVLVKQHSHPILPSKASESNNTRSSHCPVVRPGPALGCNFCWNTVDTHGRILRRKTKYHCPECQMNLCIVPCFQEYHKCHGTVSAIHANPSTLTPTVKLLPKNS